MNADDPTRKKQLGQFFTGLPVARLLATLASAGDAKTVVDPMVGIGDMLQACLEVGTTPDRMVGIELDPLAASRAARRFRENSSVTIENTDAFSCSKAETFDLVITNPPYIRYQAGNDATGIQMPTSEDIRRNLIRSVEARKGLSAGARRLFIETARAYPGTADIAVPAWILAASLVAEDGTLAVVVPQAWMHRDYAASVRSMVNTAFDVEFIVEDGDASWFSDALVRTHLLVARRRAVPTEAANRRFINARATRLLLNDAGYLAGDFMDEQSLVAALREVTDSQHRKVTAGLTGHVEATESAKPSRPIDRLQSSLLSPPLASLATYGWRAGQGLRTGANQFFYVRRTEAGYATDPRWGADVLPFPNGAVRPVIRRQSDLNGTLQVAASTLDAGVLALRGWATLEDRSQAARDGFPESWWDERYQVLPAVVAAWVHAVADTPSVPGVVGGRTFTELTAVAPNIRKGRAGEPLGYWYHLPEFAPRHEPPVLMPRVCGGRPHAYLNPDRAIVDANFATFWPTASAAAPTSAVFALLNSTWVWANLELGSNVLGGGALKVEATGLRQVPLPSLDGPAIGELARLGKTLGKSTDIDILAEVDWHVGRALGHPHPDAFTAWLAEQAREAMSRRSD